ncbi:hypothetical protein LTR56_016482 [Elasticomyces elasticus]|nr:hypothetical protein LTR56_016482 [Elasticomyces elasticus]KAK3633489.1 hypothetical protein LTR22_020109 [Elasticomyces elasticus]
MDHEYYKMPNATANHGNPHGISRLDMLALNSFDRSNSLGGAPPMGSSVQQNESDPSLLFRYGTVANPAQPHFAGTKSATSQLPSYEAFSKQYPITLGSDDFGRMPRWHLQIQSGDDNPDQAVQGSSPPHVSSGDGLTVHSNNISYSTPGLPIRNAQYQWSQQDLLAQQPLLDSGPFQLETVDMSPPILEVPLTTVFPSTLRKPTSTASAYFDKYMFTQRSQQHQHLLADSNATHVEARGQDTHFFASPCPSNLCWDSPGMSTSPMTDNARQSPVISLSTDSITDSIRQALLVSLTRPSLLDHKRRKYSQMNVYSPLPPIAGCKLEQGQSLPSTVDIRRTANFGNQNNILSGNGCLILSMAAIGALYEYSHSASKELFNAAKRMINLYLEERQKADMAAEVNGQNDAGASPRIPLWLVQVMLLNVMYGHQCGDKTAAEIANTHCAALVILARAAQLPQRPSDHVNSERKSADAEMTDAFDTKPDGHAGQELGLRTQWMKWKAIEERKRTLFAIYILSSLLAVAYHQPPTIMNSEILLDLPCDEELWAAKTEGEWQNLGGSAAAEQNAVSFAQSLSTLLSANDRRDLHYSSSQETELEFSRIELALNAWLAAWKANSRHKLERPNPFGLGPLSADSIPLLDLAYVRVFFNLGLSQEVFLRRKFDALDNELALRTEIRQHAEGFSNSEGTDAVGDAQSPKGFTENVDQRRGSLAQAKAVSQPASRRMEHLRKAAFYAADSLITACNRNLTFADALAHKLPIQSAISFFNCSQVLAEWASTVQEPVGHHLDVLGRGNTDFTTVPAIMLLESEDVELIRKIEGLCESLEAKRFREENLLPVGLQLINPKTMKYSIHNNMSLSTCGYGSRILRVTAMMLERGIVWPVTHAMAKVLETQATDMDQRAEAYATQRRLSNSSRT